MREVGCVVVGVGETGVVGVVMFDGVVGVGVSRGGHGWGGVIGRGNDMS